MVIKSRRFSRLILLLLCICCAAFSACEGSSKNTGDTGEPILSNQPAAHQTTAFDITTLDFSAIAPDEAGYIPFEKAADYYNTDLVFPMELVNKAGKALYMNKTTELAAELDCAALRISSDDFTITKRTRYEDGSKIASEEKRFYDDIDGGLRQYIVYRFDGDLDGKDEIYMLEDLINANTGSRQLFVLEQNEAGEYLFSAGTFVNSRESIAAFEYDGEYFFLLQHEDYTTSATISVELARVVKRGNDYKSKNRLLPKVLESVYLRLDNDNKSAAYSLVYENPGSGLTAGAKAYIEQIKTDLLVSNARTDGIFYGYEEVKSNGEVSPRTLYAADANNDGTIEMFSRGFDRQDGFLTVAWYSRMPNGLGDDAAKASPPFTLQTPGGYALKQMWFMPIGNKTVTFRLLQKDGELRFVLDACLYENNTAQHLAIYKIQYAPGVHLAPYWENSSSEYAPAIPLKDPDHDRAFGMLAEEEYPALVERYASPIESVVYGSESFPEKLVSMMEEGLLASSLEDTCAALCDGVELLGKAEFLSETEPYFDADTWEYADSYRRFDCYKADLDGDGEKEYVIFTSGGTAGFGDFDIYKLVGGRMVNISEDNFLIEGFNSLIRYDGKFYFVMRTHDYNTGIINGVTLFRLFPDGRDEALHISIKNNGHKAIRLFQANMPYATQICGYMESMADSLFAYSGANNDLTVFIGEETSALTTQEACRLFSIGGRDVYYKIDYNNDGVCEYLKKYMFYPTSNHQLMYLATEFYELGSSVESFAPDFRDEGLLYQLWYKDFGGKIYTFRLMNHGTEYILNAFLLENGTMHQICTYMLFPQRVINVYEGEAAEFRG